MASVTERAADEPESTTIRLKVKNTFYTLDDDLPQQGLRARLNSDPGALCAGSASSSDEEDRAPERHLHRGVRRGKGFCPSRDSPFQSRTGAAKSAPLTICGYSDDGEDTDPEEVSKMEGLHCYQYMCEGQDLEESCPPCLTSEDEGDQVNVRKIEEMHASQSRLGQHEPHQHHDESPRDLEQPYGHFDQQKQHQGADCTFRSREEDLAIAMARLSEENAKLTAQNYLLRQQYDLTQNTLGLSVQPPQQQPVQFVQVQAQQTASQVNACWISPNSGNFTPMYCLAVSVPVAHENVQQPCGHSDPVSLSTADIPQPRTGGDLPYWEANPNEADSMDSFVDAEAEPRPTCMSTGESSGSDRHNTTVLFRNIPNNYTRDMLFDLLDREGFKCLYDFVYLPIDFSTRACLGFAFINLISNDVAVRFWKIFDGYMRWVIPSKKCGRVDWSFPHQGLVSNTERYKNSPVMHEDVPSAYKPVLFRGGLQVPFPMPTQKLRMPRIRGLARRRVATAAEAATNGDATDSETPVASASATSQRRMPVWIGRDAPKCAKGVANRKPRAAAFLAMPMAVGRC